MAARTPFSPELEEFVYGIHISLIRISYPGIFQKKSIAHSSSLVQSRQLQQHEVPPYNSSYTLFVIRQ
jgi:hypothetical protein